MNGREQLLAEIKVIEATLADRNREQPDGSRLDDYNYHQWRKRAVFALTVKQTEARWLKQFMRRERDPQVEASLGELRGNLFAAAGSLVDHCRRLEERNRELEAELEEFRKGNY